MHNLLADVRIHVTDDDITTARDALGWAHVVGAPAERIEELAADHARLVRARAARLTEACEASRRRRPTRHVRVPH
jgi:hypothetical protein